jgi:hypothetical protein
LDLWGLRVLKVQQVKTVGQGQKVLKAIKVIVVL